MRSIILGNTGIQIYFRISRKDAEILAKEGFAYSGYEVKEMELYGPRYWSLGEEWELNFELLQTLRPRHAFVKHKIAGGVLPLYSADIAPPHEALGMEEGAYIEWLAGLPIGRRFLIEREELVKEEAAAASENASETLTIGLREEELAFLEFITENSETPVSQVYKAIGMSVRKGSQIRDGLKAQGLVEEIETRMGKGGKLAKLVIPTFEALELLGKEPPHGRGGAIHRYVQQLVVEGAKAKGYKAEVEKELGNEGIVDVHLERGGQHIAVEVAVVSKPERETEHIKRCLDAGYDRVFDIFADEGLMVRTQEAMSGLFSDKELARVRLLPLKKLEGFFS